MKEGAGFFAGSMAARSASSKGVFLLLLLCCASCSAFLPVAPPLGSSRMGRCGASGQVTVAPTTLLFMAKPGMSDERARQEREAEIQGKISRMKREGKMKNKDGTTQSAEDSAMLEAEAFFNKPSPRLKFEQQERKRVEVEAAAAAAAEEAAEQESKSPDDEPSESPGGVL